jgi:uncharacterized protein (DUF849 family)
MEKLVIQVRVNEGQMRDVNPHVPYSPREIADTIIECWRQGVSVVHYHAREPETGKLSTQLVATAAEARQMFGFT